MNLGRPDSTEYRLWMDPKWDIHLYTDFWFKQRPAVKKLSNVQLAWKISSLSNMATITTQAAKDRVHPFTINKLIGSTRRAELPSAVTSMAVKFGFLVHMLGTGDEIMTFSQPPRSGSLKNLKQRWDVKWINCRQTVTLPKATSKAQTLAPPPIPRFFASVPLAGKNNNYYHSKIWYQT